MKEQNPIDQLFHDRLVNRKVEYDPSDWSGAEKLLIDQEKKRFFLYRFRYYLSALIVALIGSFSFLFISADEEAPSTPAAVVEQNVESETSSPVAQSSAAVLLPTAPEREANSSSIESPVLASESDENEVIQEEMTGPEELSNEGNLVLAQTAAEDEAVPENSSVAQEETPIEPVTEETKMVVAESNDEIEVDEVVAPVVLAIENSATTGEVNAASPESEIENENENEVPEPSVELASASSVIVAEEEVVEPVAPSVVQEPVSDPVQNTNEIEANDEMGAPEPETDKIRPKERKVSGLYAIAGGGITPAISYESHSSEGNYAYFIGLGYEQRIALKFSVEARLIYANRNAYGAQYTADELYYDFGYKTQQTTIDFKRLDVLEVPIKVNYLLHPMHEIGIGVQYSRIISSSYEKSIVRDGSTIPLSSEQSEGQTDYALFNAQDFSIVLGYKYGLTQRLSLGLDLQCGLTNVIDEQYLDPQEIKNHQLRMYLTYRLIK